MLKNNNLTIIYKKNIAYTNNLLFFNFYNITNNILLLNFFINILQLNATLMHIFKNNIKLKKFPNPLLYVKYKQLQLKKKIKFKKFKLTMFMKFYKITRFNNFFKLNLYKHINLNKKSNTNHLYFYKCFLKKIHKKWFFIIGPKPSPYAWDLKNNKFLLSATTNFNLKLNKKKNKKIKNIFQNLNKISKKFYLNNFFYFFKRQIKYSQLKYLLKLKRNRINTKNSTFLFEKPLYYLNVSGRQNKKLTHFFLQIIFLYKKHKKFFFLLKHKLRAKKNWKKFWLLTNYSQNKFNIKSKIWFNLKTVNKKIPQLRELQIKIKFRLKKKFNYHLNTFKNNLPNKYIKFKKFKKYPSLNKINILKKKLKIKKKTSNIFKFKLKKLMKKKTIIKIINILKKKYYLKTKNKFLKFRFFASFLYLIFNLKNYHNVTKKKFIIINKINKKLLRYFAFKKKNKFFKWKSRKTLILTCLQIYFWNKVKSRMLFRLLRKNKIKTKLNYFLIKQKQTKFFFVFYKTPKLISFLDKKKKKNLIYRLFLYPFFRKKYRFNFVLKTHGFAYISYRHKAIFQNIRTSFLFKKHLYSFSRGIELQKFTLKKYLRTKIKISTFLQRKTPLRLKFKKYNHRLLNIFGKTAPDKFTNTNEFLKFQNLYENSNFTLSSDRYKFSSWFNKIDASDHCDNTLNYYLGNVSIKRIKFKPGYMNIWRDARNVFKTIANLNFRYQYKLTRYISKLTKFVKCKYFLLIEMQLINILIKSRLTIDSTFAQIFIKNGLIYVNGYNCCNPLFQIFVNDFIQLIVHIKYYIFFKWMLNWNIKKKKIFKIKIRKKLSSIYRTDDKMKSYKLPKWILNTKNINGDVSKFLEIDFFTLSIFVLYEPFIWTDIDYFNIMNTRYGIVNLYNWKYIT